ncbi:hypothetical protein pclt_cds_1092 [Pandoravirus celtis]|uniref:F-box domain-containing protein n=1 Tax=Pandoravirus celtis TaxID=2568002 RepID=A0A4D6EIT4_9VIRU|nr:hypothetical protein pclt_cds_1092 [Pandoravirus celtis]
MNNNAWMETAEAGDGGPGLGTLPPDILGMVLRSAGPFATGRAAGVSRRFREVAGEVAKQEKQITAEDLCSDYETCLEQFLLATAEDDANSVEYIIASGAIDPRRPLITSVATLPRPPLNPQEEDPYALLRTVPPSDEGWTPLAVAAAYGAPAVIARLASIGVRPQPRVETLINGLIQRGRKMYHAGPTVRGVGALAETYPRTSPLDPANENPLTGLREYAVERSVRLLGRFASNPGDFAAVLFESDVLPIAEALLRAGYSPDERAHALVGDARYGPSEMDLLVRALGRSSGALGAALSRGPLAASTIPIIIAPHVVLQRLLDTYERWQPAVPTYTNSSFGSDGNNAMY